MDITTLDRPEHNNTHADEHINHLAAYFSEKPNELSLTFLLEAWKRNPAAFSKLPAKLKRNASHIKTHLKAHHVDKAINSLYMQMALPNNILDTMDTYLSVAAKGILTNPEVTNNSQSKANHCIILNRTLQIVNNLKLLTNHGESGVFLQRIISLMIDFHAQEDTDITLSESLMATHLSDRVALLLHIRESSDLRKIIDFIADRIVLLGTTVITGPARAMDLSELFFVFEEIAIQAGFQVAHISNTALINEINAVMLAFSVCRKRPTAFYDVVASQQKNDKTATLPLIKRYYSRPLVLDKFLTSAGFHPYFGKRNSLDGMNQQALMILFVTQLSRQANKHNDNQQRMIYEINRFTRLCQQKLCALNHNHLSFMQWFTEAATDCRVHPMIESLFFSDIEESIASDLSQVGSLVFVANKLVSMGFPPRSAAMASTGLFQPLISPEVPMTDAKNLKAINLFFNALETSQKQQLLNEILLAMVIQTDTPHPISCDPMIKKQQKPVHARIKSRSAQRSQISAHVIRQERFFSPNSGSHDKEGADEALMRARKISFKKQHNILPQ